MNAIILTDSSARERKSAAIMTTNSIKMMELLAECGNLFRIVLIPHPPHFSIWEGDVST
jgi:hypothetical protein